MMPPPLHAEMPAAFALSAPFADATFRPFDAAMKRLHAYASVSCFIISRYAFSRFCIAAPLLALYCPEREPFIATAFRYGRHMLINIVAAIAFC